MKQIGIGKITLNIGTGKPGAELEKAKILLEKLSGMKPAETRTQKRIPTWGLRPNLVIGCKVTVRGEEADKLLAMLLQAKDNSLSERAFDTFGNFSFGVKEYLEVPNMNYIPEVGIMGLEVAVTLRRKGFRVKHRALRQRKIPRRHSITKEEALAFAQEKFQVHIIESEEAE